MKLLIHGRNLEITPALRDYTQTKLERATSHFGDAVRGEPSEPEHPRTKRDSSPPKASLPLPRRQVLHAPLLPARERR